MSRPLQRDCPIRCGPAYYLAQQSSSLAVFQASLAIALGTRLWWERPAKVFERAPQWWGRPERPPPLRDDRLWVRLPQMCVLTGTLGIVASVAMLGVLYWFRALPGPLTDRYVLCGLLFGLLVLAPISHWLGRPRWQSWMSIVVGAVAFGAPAVLGLIPAATFAVGIPAASSWSCRTLSRLRL